MAPWLAIIATLILMALVSDASPSPCQGSNCTIDRDLQLTIRAIGAHGRSVRAVEQQTFHGIDGPGDKQQKRSRKSANGLHSWTAAMIVLLLAAHL